MYSLTKATQIFIEKYIEATQEDKSQLVKRYNAHKVRHTMGVLECGRIILLYMKQNGFYDEKLFNQAEITFILHDIARVFQNDGKEILSFNDFDHGAEGYKILKEIGIYYEMVCLAVKYHDKLSIDGIYEEKGYLELSQEDRKKAIFLAKIIRDADKVQNMIYSIYNPNDFFFNLGGNYINGPISDKNFEDIKNKKLISKDNLKTKIDVVMISFSRIFDIEFTETIKLLKSFNYYEEMIKILKSLEGCDEKFTQELDKYYGEFFN